MGALNVCHCSRCVRLMFQCKYSGQSVEALVFDVNSLPPPLPVAVIGPLRVELLLGSGQCFHKGCVEGKLSITFPSVIRDIWMIDDW